MDLVWPEGREEVVAELSRVFLSQGRRLEFPSYTEKVLRSVHGRWIVLTLKNSPNVELYGLQGLPLTYFYHTVSLVSFDLHMLDRPDLS